MTKPREKTREELQAEIEDGKKKIRHHYPTAPCMTAWGFIMEKRAYVASITLKST